MNLIAAVDENWGIGYQDMLQVHIPTDLKRFQALTMGHTVLLGRKTLETFPGGRPLRGRRNLILSTNSALQVPGAEVYPTRQAVLAAAPADTFVIGGESVYRQMLPCCDTAYITKLGARLPADRYLPNLDLDPEWEVAEESPEQTYEGISFRFVTYRRK